jgi:hypothetical protein
MVCLDIVIRIKCEYKMVCLIDIVIRMPVWKLAHKIVILQK